MTVRNSNWKFEKLLANADKCKALICINLRSSDTKREELLKAQRQDEINAGLSKDLLESISQEENDDNNGEVDESDKSISSLAASRRSSNRVEEQARKVFLKGVDRL